MQRFDRHQEILKTVQENGSVSLLRLVDSLNHSVATIRRDLVDLERDGKVLRTHGGAVLPQRLAMEPGFSEKRHRNQIYKEQIAGCVLAAIPVGVTVFVDAGSTCLVAGVRLLERGKNPIYTNSIPLLTAGCQYPGLMTAIGGELRSVSRALVGGLALDWLDKLSFEVALLGASALCENGAVKTTEIQEASLKAKVIQCSTKAYLLADSDKLTDSATVEFARLSNFDAWYADSRLSTSHVRQLNKANRINIMLSEPHS